MPAETVTQPRLLQLAAALYEARQRKSAAEDALDDAKTEAEALEGDLAGEMLDNEVSKVTWQGHTFYLSTETHVTCNNDNREALNEWLRDHNFAGLIKETVHPSTLRGWYREQEDDELPRPDHLLHVYRKQAVRIRNG